MAMGLCPDPLQGKVDFNFPARLLPFSISRKSGVGKGKYLIGNALEND